MTKHVVGTVAEIPPGARKVVEIAGRTIGVFNLNGEFFAVRNTCPHQGGPLCEGRQTGLRQASVPGEYTYTRQGEILRCPWHGWEFDIRTGQSWWNPEKVRTRAYKVSVETVTGGEAPPQTDEGTRLPQPGPYTAETYPVTVEEQVEQQVVVVEVP